MWSTRQPSGPELPTPISRPTLTSSAHASHSIGPPFPRCPPAPVFLPSPSTLFFFLRFLSSPITLSCYHQKGLYSVLRTSGEHSSTCYHFCHNFEQAASFYFIFPGSVVISHPSGALVLSVDCGLWRQRAVEHTFSPSDPVSRTSSFHRRISEPTQLSTQLIPPQLSFQPLLDTQSSRWCYPHERPAKQYTTVARLNSFTTSTMSAVRATALRAGGACVRCRKGKTKCVYENGRAPCKNCAKGLHECYLPSESMSHGGHGVSPARTAQRVRETLPSERASGNAAAERHGPSHSTSVTSRNNASANEKYVRGFFPLHVSPFLASRQRPRVPSSVSSLYVLSSHSAVHCSTIHTMRSVTRSRLKFGVAFQPIRLAQFSPIFLLHLPWPRGWCHNIHGAGKTRHSVELVNRT